MIYRAIGVMSGSSLDGLDLAFVEFDESRGVWNYQVKAAACISFPNELRSALEKATELSAKEYLLLHAAFGRHIGTQINAFIDENNLFHQIQLIASHGHTSFHLPAQHMTAQLGDGAQIAAITGVNTVSDLRNIDVALGGQGAPIVPIGEKLLWPEHDYYLNLGGIANISVKGETITAFDVCAANRVLNMLAQKEGKEFDAGGAMAAKGKLNTALLTQLNAMPYYKQSFPKSLANEFGTQTVFPLVESFNLSIEDALHTYTEHIAQQITYGITGIIKDHSTPKKILITGGGALNDYLIQRIKSNLSSLNIEVVVPDTDTVQYKEAIVMALLGVLRWREENTVLSSVTGAQRDSIGGAVWIGQEA